MESQIVNLSGNSVIDVRSYLDTIFKMFHKGTQNTRCYRGQSCADWAIKPSVMRGLKPDAENMIFSELMLEAPSEFSSDKSMFEKLVRSQHYGLPTRLLDVSLNPLVALYFSCSDSSQVDHDGIVYIFDFPKSRVKYADSDSISVICNLSRLSDAERSKIAGYEVEDLYNPRDEFNRMPEVKRLVSFIKVEKPYFLNLVDPGDVFKYFFVYPAKSNKRVIAQSGAFIAAGLVRFSKLGRHMAVRAIGIPKEFKERILVELDVLNINSRTMFPEIEFASKYIKDKWNLTRQS